MPLISTLCLRVLIVRVASAVFKRQVRKFGRAVPAVCVPKLLTCRAEVTTNVEYERVLACGAFPSVPSDTQMRYTVAGRRAEDRQLTVMGY